MTTHEVLQMMEEWYEQHKDDEGFDDAMPFKGFDCLLGADLTEVDLSGDTIKQRADEYRSNNPDAREPPWKSIDGGVQLAGAVLSTGESIAQLQGADFTGAQLERAFFEGAQLQEARFLDANLEEARFPAADLQGARFSGAQIQAARFPEARLGGAYLETELTDARLQYVAWDGDYILGSEIGRDFGSAENEYRQLKQYYNGVGQYDHAGEFHKRELLMKRRQLWGKGVGAWRAAAVLLVSATLMGHGERPSWVVAWVFACFAAFTAAYWLLGALPETPGLVESIRHSAQMMVSFARREDLATWAQDAGLVQSFISYVLLALFLVTFVRKVSPR